MQSVIALYPEETKFTLCVRQSNKRARHLYETLGFFYDKALVEGYGCSASMNDVIMNVVMFKNRKPGGCIINNVNCIIQRFKGYNRLLGLEKRTDWRW